MKCKIIVLPVVIALSITTVAHAQLYSSDRNHNNKGHNEWSVQKVVPYINEDESMPVKRVSVYAEKYVKKMLESLNNARMRIKNIHGNNNADAYVYQSIITPLGTKPK